MSVCEGLATDGCLVHNEILKSEVFCHWHLPLFHSEQVPIKSEMDVNFRI